MGIQGATAATGIQGATSSTGIQGPTSSTGSTGGATAGGFTGVTGTTGTANESDTDTTYGSTGAFYLPTARNRNVGGTFLKKGKKLKRFFKKYLTNSTRKPTATGSTGP